MLVVQQEQPQELAFRLDSLEQLSSFLRLLTQVFGFQAQATIGATFRQLIAQIYALELTTIRTRYISTLMTRNTRPKITTTASQLVKGRRKASKSQCGFTTRQWPTFKTFTTGISSKSPELMVN